MPQSVEESIRQAMQDGKFDNLPGKGKPLRWDENPNEDPEMALAHHVLKSAGYTLPWIETRRTIEADLEQARAALRRNWNWRGGELAQGHPPAQVDAEWQRALEAFRTQVAVINKRIFSYNLEVPSESLQRSQVNTEKEIEAISGRS